MCPDATLTEFYTRSLHDALPICLRKGLEQVVDRMQLEGLDRVLVVGGGEDHAGAAAGELQHFQAGQPRRDRKSTRLNSSHVSISYAVFCLQNKTNDKSPRLIYSF